MKVLVALILFCSIYSNQAFTETKSVTIGSITFKIGRETGSCAIAANTGDSQHVFALEMSGDDTSCIEKDIFEWNGRAWARFDITRPEDIFMPWNSIPDVSVFSSLSMNPNSGSLTAFVRIEFQSASAFGFDYGISFHANDGTSAISLDIVETKNCQGNQIRFKANIPSGGFAQEIPATSPLMEQQVFYMLDLTTKDAETLKAFALADEPPCQSGSNNGDPVVEWTAARDGKCLSCLNPHDTNPSADPVSWCTDTSTCQSGTGLSCSSISTAKSCTTDAAKQEDPACEIVSNLRLTKTPKVSNIALPADSYCIIKLTGITQTMKVTYAGSGAVYYPATGDWDSKTLQPTDTQLDSVSRSRILQASGTTELTVAIVNYDISSSEIFTIEAADPSVPDNDDGLSASQITGIAIGSATFLFLVLGALVWVVRRKQETKRKTLSKNETVKTEGQGQPIMHQDLETKNDS